PVIVQSVPFLEAHWADIIEAESVPLGAVKRLAISADDPGGILDRVAFYVNGILIEESQFAYADWTPDTTGNALVQARVTDAFGNAYWTEALNLRIAELHPPVVQIRTPADWSRVVPGSSVAFDVVATDSDGVVTNLTLTRFSTPEASSTNNALSSIVNDLPAGENIFTVLATDDTGQTGEATVHVVVDRLMNASLAAPRDLVARPFGCNAISLSWNLSPGGLPEIVVVEQSDGDEDIWKPVAFLPAQRTSFVDHFLAASTRQRYRAFSKTPDEVRSDFSNIAEARTRSWLPRFAALDLAESLVDSGTITLASSDLPPEGARLYRVSHGLRRIDNNFLAVGVDYLNGLIPLGVSDNNRVLMINGISSSDTRTFLWRPDGPHQQFDRRTFEPYRLALPGVPVGSRLSVVHDSGGHDVSQYHAGLWVEDFLDFTPDVNVLRIPANHNRMDEPYVTRNILTDVNAAGVGVGGATWAYFESNEPDSHLLLPPVLHATFWAGFGQPAYDFGALQQLNNESEFLAINDAGDIVGVSRLLDPANPGSAITHAVRSHSSLATVPGDKLTDLGTLGGIFSAALSINRHGWAVGYSTVRPDDPIEQTRATYWQPDETFPRQLNGFGPELKTYGRAINDDFWIVGDAVRTNGQQVAALWTPNFPANPGRDFDVSDLNEHLSSSDWLLVSARHLNKAGLIAGQGWHSTTVLVDGVPEVETPVPRAFLLVPNVSLAVDYNRDGRIELNGKDDLPEETPYQFWVNDDTDRGEEAVGNSDVPGARAGLLEFDGRDPNHSDFQVNGVCDLIDWFPVFLNITNLLELLPPDANEYRLAQADDALNFVYTDLRPDDVGRYLTNTLDTGFGPDFNQAAASATCLPVTANGAALSPAFLQRIRDDGRGVLLFEARKASDQPLRLEVWNQRRLAAVVELPLRISGVEDMYGWLNLRGLTGQETSRDSALDPPNEPLFDRQDRSVVFVHGYNVNEQQSRGWMAEVFKRLWWSGSNTRFYGVSWHGDESQIAGVSVNFQANVVNAFSTAPALAAFINGLSRQGGVTLIAHSLGNMMASAAIQDYGARPSRYFMVDAAVAIEAYIADADLESPMTHSKWKRYEDRLFASEWYQLFPGIDGRSGLTWRGRFGDVLQRTAVYNFYSSGEEVLKNMDIHVNTVIGGLARGIYDLGLGVTGSYAWGMQETLKGTGITGYFLSSSHGGWGFSWDYGLVIEGGGDAAPYHIPLEPDKATAVDIPDDMLRLKPFFLAGPFEFHIEDASAYANGNRATLLAEMFPARTMAIGCNRLAKSRDPEATDQARGSFDMNKALENGWPVGRLANGKKQNNWFHSDLKNVAYLFTHRVFDTWVALGSLR
ncbi:MAG TPA: alpha/beta hydrolase, partial [Candidatus Nitrosotalea sp.]|nr:alpha/beta hydrolase [Candidatus Nitrosotalea sp.]